MIDRLKILIQFVLWFHWRLIKQLNADKLIQCIGIFVSVAFMCGMIFLFIMMTWFPEWERNYDKNLTKERMAKLSKKIGRNATFKDYKKTLSNVDVSTSVGFVDAIFGIKK